MWEDKTGMARRDEKSVGGNYEIYNCHDVGVVFG